MEKSLERCMGGRDPPHRKESHLYEYSNIYGWREVYYLRKSRVYFFRLPDGTPIQVYPIW